MSNPQERETITLLTLLGKYWHFVAVIVGLIVSWAHFQTTQASVDSRLNKIEIQSAAIQEDYQKNVSETSGNIKEINAKLDIILRKVQL